ncbi:MAG: nicotinate-nucleotide--dimethylbenzimidazole phosphoribosyltransferase [Actinomycetota bacterium]
MTGSLARLLRDLPGPDEEARAAVRDRAANVLRPAGALARLDEIAVWLAGWQRRQAPAVRWPHTAIFVADHGVVTGGVSAYPAEVTKAMLDALRDGVATSAALARAVGSTFDAVDVGVGEPTGDIRVEPAMDAGRFGACVAAGAGASDVAAEAGADLLIVGEMGIGNTTPAAAVCAALFGGDPAGWTGRGTGVDDDGLARKVAAVTAARDRVAAVTEDPLEVLLQVGGAELVAIAAAVAQARRRSIPVLLDGFVVGAAVAALALAAPGALAHCLASHRSAEPGHRLLLERLGMAPVLDLDLRLGEGSGALVALPLIRLAAVAVTDVATFQERGLA